MTYWTLEQAEARLKVYREVKNPNRIEKALLRDFEEIVADLRAKAGLQ